MYYQQQETHLLEATFEFLEGKLDKKYAKNMQNYITGLILSKKNNTNPFIFIDNQSGYSIVTLFDKEAGIPQFNKKDKKKIKVTKYLLDYFLTKNEKEQIISSIVLIIKKYEDNIKGREKTITPRRGNINSIVDIQLKREFQVDKKTKKLLNDFNSFFSLSFPVLNAKNFINGSVKSQSIQKLSLFETVSKMIGASNKQAVLLISQKGIDNKEDYLQDINQETIYSDLNFKSLFAKIKNEEENTVFVPSSLSLAAMNNVEKKNRDFLGNKTNRDQEEFEGKNIPKKIQTLMKDYGKIQLLGNSQLTDKYKLYKQLNNVYSLHG